MRIAIIGGGAAGFFCAINLKEKLPPADVTIFEAAHKPLRKVEISGGGRCNCTNTFREVGDLQQVYPRGHRLLKRLFKTFNETDARKWFENHGVKLTVQEDQCVFPVSQDAHTIVNMFLATAQRLGIRIVTGRKIESLDELADYDRIVVTTGGAPQTRMLQWLGHPTEPSVPSLFTLNIADNGLRALMGTVAEDATAFIPGTKLRARGPLLITHWGLSGPAILRLSSHAARQLAQSGYRLPLNINWPSANEADAAAELNAIIASHPQKQVQAVRPFTLSARLWTYLCEKCLASRATARWQELSRKELNRLTNQIVNDSYLTDGRAAFKEEFVTCGGIQLSAVDPNTLESKTRPGLYFAGEVLDIDGVTGGFNFQAAWTTAYVVAQAISRSCR